MRRALRRGFLLSQAELPVACCCFSRMPAKNPTRRFGKGSRQLCGLALAIFLLGAGTLSFGADAVSQPTSPKLMVAPSSSKLAGGTAKLDVAVLSRSGAAYVGGYRLKIFPYFFMNESGQLEIEVSDSQLQKMLGGGATSFTGQAQATGSEVVHKITAQATPGGDGRGALTFTVATHNGPLVFNTSYRVIPP